MPAETQHELVCCPACTSTDLEHDEERCLWRCGECGSAITQEGVERLAGAENEGPTGPLDDWP